MRRALFVTLALSLPPETGPPLVLDTRPEPIVWKAVSALHALRTMDADLLAGLALGEDRDAAAAVMWTAVNRAKGRPLLQAVTERQAYGSVVRGRFRRSWTLDPERRYGIGETRRYAAIAHAILAGKLQDPTQGATHFHRHGTWVPTWAPDETEWETFGVHAFYQERMGEP